MSDIKVCQWLDSNRGATNTALKMTKLPPWSFQNYVLLFIGWWQWAIPALFSIIFNSFYYKYIARCNVRCWDSNTWLLEHDHLSVWPDGQIIFKYLCFCNNCNLPNCKKAGSKFCQIRHEFSKLAKSFVIWPKWWWHFTKSVRTGSEP